MLQALADVAAGLRAKGLPAKLGRRAALKIVRLLNRR
jgi:hypothetical protein